MSRKQSILAITKESWLLLQRMFARSLMLALLTAIAFVAVDYLVESGIGDRFALVRRFPEFIPFLLAAAQLTFIELSVFWIRFMTQPKIDVQAAIQVANDTAMGAAIVHLTNTLAWAFRIGVFLYLVA